VNKEERRRLDRLLAEQRWAALATLDDGGLPSVAHVAYVPEPDYAGFLIHVSRLAAHTRHLLARPQAALGITEPDPGADDPQQRARVSLQGRVEEIQRGAPDYPVARARYLGRLPQAAQWFDFEDFVLLRLRPESVRYVGGFARAYSLKGEELRHISGEWA
jgi:putative heme iron utilization protein